MRLADARGAGESEALPPACMAARRVKSSVVSQPWWPPCFGPKPTSKPLVGKARCCRACGGSCGGAGAKLKQEMHACLANYGARSFDILVPSLMATCDCVSLPCVSAKARVLLEQQCLDVVLDGWLRLDRRGERAHQRLAGRSITLQAKPSLLISCLVSFRPFRSVIFRPWCKFLCATRRWTAILQGHGHPKSVKGHCCVVNACGAHDCSTRLRFSPEEASGIAFGLRGAISTLCAALLGGLVDLECARVWVGGNSWGGVHAGITLLKQSLVSGR